MSRAGVEAVDPILGQAEQIEVGERIGIAGGVGVDARVQRVGQRNVGR